MFIEIPKYIKDALNMLKEAGYKAYIVGGCVRDALLNKKPNDWDICTSALPEKTCEVFKDFNLVTSGIKHGTVCVIINHLPVEITTFRIDGNYKDSRRPESVTFSPSIDEDLKRRDFTINAMAYADEEIIDLHSGQDDLENKIIRTVGIAKDRFNEDALRIMRALRFAGQLGFKIEESTKQAILDQKDLLKNISAERITDEFVKLVMSDNCFDILKEYESVIKVFLPSFRVPSTVKLNDDLTLRLSYILSASEPQNMFRILKLPKAVTSDIKVITSNLIYKIPETKKETKYMLGKFGTKLSCNILKFKALLGESTQSAIKLVQEVINNNECYSTKQLNISGNDLIDLGFKGTLIGTILNSLLEAVIEDKVKNTKRDLIEYIKKGM